MNVMRNRTRLAALSVVALVSLGTLSGCGDVHPGAAAVVGDSTLSSSDADTLSRDLCKVVTEAPEQATQSFPRSVALEAVVQRYVMRSIASQMADDYGVESSSTYAADAAAAKKQLDYLDPEVRDRVLDLLVADRYFNDVLSTIGQQQLLAEGATDPTAEDDLARGIALAQAWESDNGVDINPRFPALTLGDTQFEQTPDRTSVAVSQFAKDAATSPADDAWVEALPASQKCG
ncbi:exported hypothetical protein [metagenome]|uniref:Lipoprotein n=1 Tax=metagenome TaxID=256318 RepID=A0A2P2BZF0_9ZZZZ